MINIYKSNKIEVISQLLAKELIINPPFITEKLDIAVPNYFLGKWLREQITISNQISALYELKTISNYTEDLLTNFFPGIDMGIWNYETIKWGIIDSFEELNYHKESLPLNSWINKSNILVENNKNLEGLKFSKEAIKKHPTDKKLKNNYAVFLFKCGFQKEALNIYREFEDENLHFKDSYINYSNLLIITNNLSKALEIINKLILEGDNNLEALRQRALIYKLLLDYNKSEEDLLQSIQIDKLNIISNQMIVKLYIDIKKYEEAIKYCDLMLSEKKDVNFFLTKKIICKINLGNWLGLEKDLKIFNKNLKYTQSSINPLSLKYINDDPLFQKKFTENYWDEKPKNNYLSIISNKHNQKTTRN